MRYPWFSLLVLLVLLAGCAPQPWKQDPDVQAAKQDCAGLPQGEHYACIERHAVTSLNPEVCRLAGIWVDDACLQAVYQTADNPAICERLYRPGVAETCRAYYQRPAVDFATSTLINAGGEPGRQTIGYRVVVVHHGNRPVEDLTAWLLFPEAEGLPAQVQLQRTEIAPAELVQPNQGRVYEGEIAWETEHSREAISALLDRAQIRLAWTLDGQRQEKLFPPSTEKGPDWGTAVTASLLPTPASAEEAALTELRPLTTSGLAWFGDWASDGESLVYTIAMESPLLYSGEPGCPEFEVWWMRADGSGARRLTSGYSLFFSADGQTVFFLRSPGEELWAVDVRGGAPHRLLGPIGGLTVHQLDDGRLVVSESGTYAPPRLFDPATGTLSDLSGPWPTNFPEEARLSPDGTRLAYPHEQEQAVYLAEADGSNPQLLSQGGGFSALVWWSPNSQRLAYTTGNHWTDRLMVADRDGGNRVVLLPSLEESGYIASLAWSPDSRMLLVATDAYDHQTPRPTRLLLLDADGSGQRQLLEAYLHGVSWSPDGHTLALSRWGGPQGEMASHSIWLATLTDHATVAKLPPPTPEPLPTATPPLPLPSANLSPEEVIRRFWEAIDAGDHLTAWASLITQRRARQGLAYFTAEWQCVQEAHVVDIRPMEMEAGAESQMFQVKVDVKMTGDCFNGMAPGPFTVLVRETPDGPWLIDSFNTGP